MEVLATGRSNKVGPMGAIPAKVPIIGLDQFGRASRGCVPDAAIEGEAGFVEQGRRMVFV